MNSNTLLPHFKICLSLTIRSHFLHSALQKPRKQDQIFRSDTIPCWNGMTTCQDTKLSFKWFFWLNASYLSIPLLPSKQAAIIQHVPVCIYRSELNHNPDALSMSSGFICYRFIIFWADVACNNSRPPWFRSTEPHLRINLTAQIKNASTMTKLNSNFLGRLWEEHQNPYTHKWQNHSAYFNCP